MMSYVHEVSTCKIIRYVTVLLITKDMFAPAPLQSAAQLLERPLCQFKAGDYVRVELELEILKALQEGHGGWNPKMAMVIGMIGVVHRVTEKNDVRVSFEEVYI